MSIKIYGLFLAALFFCLRPNAADAASGAVTVDSAKPAKTEASQQSLPLKPTSTQEEAARYIAQYLIENHYRKVAIGDSLSIEIFNRYLDNLDASHSYFMAGEVESLKKNYANRIDDEFFSGRVNAGFAIYNSFLKRAKEKLRFMKAVADTVHFDFSTPETLELDRKNASWPADRAALQSLWKKELKYQWLNQKYSGENSKEVRATVQKSLQSRLNLLKRQTPEDAFQAYAYALTSSFDPHTIYFSPDEFENFQIDLSRSLEGIGAKLQTENEYTLVHEIIPGGPAFKSGLLKKGDKITGVGQGKKGEIVDVIGWRINDVVKLIRGRKGTIVRLRILPASQGGRGPAKIIQIERDKVDLEEQAAHKKIMRVAGKKVGVITIPSFYLDFEGQRKKNGEYNSTTKDVARIVNQLNEAGVDAIIIDLRDNGGGSLEEAVNVTGLFIPGGPVVQITNSNGGKMVLRDEDRQFLYGGPLVVLVNRYSASASEIFAAAIQDYGRGLVVGERTFGKGTVQSIVKINRPYTLFSNEPDLGQMKLTIAKFYRISGGSTQHKGVVPDIVMPSLIDTTAIGEDTYPSSLPWSTISEAFYYPSADVEPEGTGTLQRKFKLRVAEDPAYQGYLADIQALNQIRKKKTVPLQEKSFRAETEKIKQIEERWVEDSEAKNKGQGAKDIVLRQTARIAVDLAEESAKAPMASGNE